VDAVHAIGVHVIRKPAAAANAADHYNIFFWDAQIGHNALHLRQNAVVATARAPPYLLIGSKIFGGKGWSCCFGLGSCGTCHKKAIPMWVQK
jgi:hypothetical protein